MPSERVIQFYDLNSFAVIGVSRSRRNFAWMIYDELGKLGKKVYGINSENGVRTGIHLYRSIDSLPETPEAIIVCVDPDRTKGLLDELRDSGAKYIWFQQGSCDGEVSKLVEELGLDPIRGCALMYMPGTPVFHRFHRAINEFLGKGYK